MEEVITIHIGQAGCQSGNNMWELLCLEHDITPEGDMTFKHDDESAHTFFQETNNGQYVPRALFLDLEATVIDSIRTGQFRKLHHPNNMLNYIEDGANCWARGRYNTGKQIIEEATYRLRRLIESCNSVQGFLNFYSVGGGTGGGFSALMRETIIDDFFKKRQTVGVSIYPSPNISTCIVEPYNALLATVTVELKNDVNLVFDNEALYQISKSKLGLARPTYTNLNRLIAQVVSSMTQSLRFDGELNIDFNEFTTNLVPFPRINLLVASLSPLQTELSAQKDAYTVTDITLQAFDNENIMAACDINQGSFMACCLMYRGDVLPRNVNQALFSYKDQNLHRFVDWCPSMFKVGIAYQEITKVPGSSLPESRRSVCMIANATSVVQVLKKMEKKQRMMWSKHAFKHWYMTNGMEEAEMENCLDKLIYLREDYRWAGESNKTVGDFNSGKCNFSGYYNAKYEEK